jgi:hypothetical protein
VLPALALHTGINSIPDFAMRDPGRYERSMGLCVVLMLVLGIAIALRNRRLWRPVAAASIAFGLLFGGSERLAHASPHLALPGRPARHEARSSRTGRPRA